MLLEASEKGALGDHTAGVSKSCPHGLRKLQPYQEAGGVEGCQRYPGHQEGYYLLDWIRDVRRAAQGLRTGHRYQGQPR